MKQKELLASKADNLQPSYVSHTTQTDQADGCKCPNCGTVNDPGAMFCENCGFALRQTLCPHCGAVLEPGTDFCEACGNYVSDDRCSFCSAALTKEDAFCPECGAPREGLECPVCHSLTKFAFCSVCGSAVTDSAQEELQKAWDIPYANKIKTLSDDLEKLWMTKPVQSQREREMREKNNELRNRVLNLLRNDGELSYPEVRVQKPIMEKGKLEDEIFEKMQELQKLLDQMEMPQMETPAQARIISMARKPGVSRLGWRCNYKNALHSSPLGCSCPQMGGKWIVLTSENQGSVQDDK